MDTNTTTDLKNLAWLSFAKANAPATILAAIICEQEKNVDHTTLSLAEAILAHPVSQWGPVLPVPTDAELEANFRAWFKTRYDSNYLGGISLCDVIHWVKHLPQQSPQPAAPWPQLPPQPPGSPSRGENPYWTGGFAAGWHAARAELQRLREQAGAPPTPAPALPEISTQLIKMLIGDVLSVTGTAIEQSCLDRCWNPVPEVRARLMEILQLAAQGEAAKRPAS